MRMLTAPDSGTPELVETDSQLAATITQLKAGEGPIAIDAERASGFRYSARAYLIQLNRRSGGLHLIDPIALQGSAQIRELDQLIQNQECIIHASSQDLTCLREFGLNPCKLFDTELGARLAGFPRVGLAPLCEALLEISLAKEHSAVDWSIRPLRSEWLDYAALDVAVLIDLKEKIEESLSAAGKLEWAKAEFAAALEMELQRPRSEPWRRTSGIHQIRSRFELAIIRNLWEARDLVAREIDLAPGRLLNDAVIIELARLKPATKSEFLAIPIVKFRIRNEVQTSYIDHWLTTLTNAYQVPETNWPEMRARGDSLPAPRIWRDKFPIANAQLLHARKNLAEISTKLAIPQENLISPDALKRLLFNDGREVATADSPKSRSEVSQALAKYGVRKWQIELTLAALCQARGEVSPPPREPAETEPDGEAEPSEQE